MKKIDGLYKEYNSLKNKISKDKSLNLKEDFKNKLMELDYNINVEYEKSLDNDFPMTTTLEKEEERLEKLISFVEEKKLEQKELINDYKKLTGDVIELTYLRYTDNLKDYKERLNQVRKIVSIISDIKELLNNPKGVNEVKLKVLKNKLMKPELLSLLYEFCLIDSLDVKDIDVDMLISSTAIIDEDVSSVVVEELPQVEEEIIEKKSVQKVDKKYEVKEEKVEEKVVKEEVELPVEEPQNQQNNILTSMPTVEKIGSVVPVNVFESLKKTGQILPDVVLPSNGLKDDENDVFLDTKDLFGENEKK